MTTNLHELIFMSVIYISGFLFSSLFLDKEKPYFIAVTSIFAGVSLCLLVFFPLFIIFGKISTTTLYLVGLLQISILLSALLYKFRSFKKIFPLIFLYLPIFLIFLIIFNYNDINIFCGDTFLLSKCAKTISVYPDNFKKNIGSAANWGALLLLVQHISYELGKPYFISFQPLLLLSFILCFQSVTYKALICMNVSHRMSFSASLLSMILLATTPIFLEISFLIHTNSLITYYLFLFISFYWMGEALKERGWSYLSYLFMFTVAFTRVEGPVYCTIILICMLFKESLKDSMDDKKVGAPKNGKDLIKSKKTFFTDHLIYISIFLIIGFWYIFQYVLGTDNELLSKERALFLAALFMLMPFFIVLLNSKYFSFFKENFLTLLNIGAIGGFVLTYVFFPTHFFASLTGIYRNLSTPFWEGFLIFTMTSLVLIFFKKGGKIILDKSILTSILLIILSIIVFSLFRQPFYASLYDSSNRLFVMLIPIIIFYIVLKFYSVKSS